jgi:hypothetical protein
LNFSSFTPNVPFDFGAPATGRNLLRPDWARRFWQPDFPMALMDWTRPLTTLNDSWLPPQINYLNQVNFLFHRDIPAKVKVNEGTKAISNKTPNIRTKKGRQPKSIPNGDVPDSAGDKGQNPREGRRRTQDQNDYGSRLNGVNEKSGKILELQRNPCNKGFNMRLSGRPLQ